MSSQKAQYFQEEGDQPQRGYLGYLAKFLGKKLHKNERN